MKKKIILVTVMLTVALVQSCHSLETTDTKISETPRTSVVQNEAGATTLISESSTTSGEPLSLVRGRVPSEKIIAIAEMSPSLSHDPGINSQMISSDVVVIAKTLKQIETKYIAKNAFPITIVEVEILETLKGDSSNIHSVGIIGGTVTVDDYIANNNLKDSVLEDIEKQREIKGDDLFVDVYFNEYVDINAEEEYLFFLGYNKENDVYIQSQAGYSTYKKDDGADTYSNSVLKETVGIEKLNELSKSIN